jgi:formylglycine-generating enzyme required for sulfatase activity
MRYTFSLALALACSVFVSAQQMAVKSFRLLENDLTAQVYHTKIDQNGHKAALIKVETTQTGFEFDGGSLGIVAVEQKTAEVWVYVPYKAKTITIKHAQLGIIRGYAYPIAIEAGRTYVMELVSGTVETIVKPTEIETQWLAINTTPEGANVFIEDMLVGTTPFSRKYPEGDYVYRIELPRYHNEAGKVTLKGDRETLTFTMRPKFGNISITSAPENGMAIYLNDENTGRTTPATLAEVPSGNQTVKLISQWYQPQAKLVTVTDNQTARADFTMEPAFADITVTTKPVADIVIDGAHKGNGTYTARMMAGVYTVKAELAKHHPDQKQLTVMAGKPQTITLNLKPQTGSLDITSTPFDATITIDGKNHGTTPRTVKDLLVGTYTLTLTKQGYGTVTKTITIAEGKTADINETLPSGMEVTITSTPSGAQLWVNGNPAGTTPVTTTLAFGNHTIKLVNSKKEVVETITVTQGGEGRWDYNVSEFSNFTETFTVSISRKRSVKVNLEMVAVQGGTFTMGCTGEQGGDCDSDEKPTFQATVSDFYIGRYEITQAQWRALMGASTSLSSPSYFKNCDNCPVENVSWNDVQEFIKKLNQQMGKKYRLPTEAEWEYAARGGLRSKGYKYAGSNSIDEVAWYTSNSGSKTKPVGGKKPNELGLYDMSGNVWEWCEDWYSSYTSNSKNNPTGPYRVLRGGSWDTYARGCRVSRRGSITPGNRGGSRGFRLVLVP